jgi:hypothetical protein
MSNKARKHIHAELNKNRDKTIDDLADMDIENRTSRHEDEPNRYQQILKDRKEQKYQREQEKRKIVHLGKKIQKRAKAETEE